jgi:hypothetical protein
MSPDKGHIVIGMTKLATWSARSSAEGAPSPHANRHVV